MKKKVLVVDDEIYILELLQVNLESNGFHVTLCERGEDVIPISERVKPDLILLDLMLPGIDGFEVCKKIRSHPTLSKTVIIMVTARDEEIDLVLGLELGADDYITKPFGIREILARIKATFRRIDFENIPRDVEHEKELIISDLNINTSKREVSRNGKIITLTYLEYKLLEVLALNRDRVFPREDLFREVWGYDMTEETRTLDVHIRKLRKKLQEDDKYPAYIETIRGIGYRMK